MNDFARGEIESSLSARFETQVRRSPEQIALRSAGFSCTYRELNICANRLARQFLPPDEVELQPVLLLLGHGALEIIALLAVLKSGRAYVALNPQTPLPRLRQIAADVGADLVLTCRAHADCAAMLDAQVVELPDAATMLASARDPDTASAADDNLNLDIAPGALASLVYTSGSTGAPKGVMRSHRCSLHRCWLFQHTLRFRSDERIAHMFSCGFAAAEVDTYGALLNGATLCCYPLMELGLDPLADWLAAEKISMLHPPLTLLRRFLDSMKQPLNLPSLHTLFLAGEAVYRHDVERIHHLLPGCAIEHRFSSSEASVLARHIISPAENSGDAVLAVGAPVPDKEIRLLDSLGQEVPPGEIGEIVVESRYLSPGYWRQPELTAEKFTSIPCTGEMDTLPLVRFHTGDLGQYKSAGGKLYHLGRIDAQVKVHGYRIEPMEVEAALLGLGTLKAAAVFGMPDKRGEMQLLSAVVAHCPETWSEAETRRLLAQQLPLTMIPAHLMAMPELPITASGKIDRNRLAAEYSARLNRPDAMTAPYEHSEVELAEIEAALLQHPAVLNAVVLARAVESGDRTLLAFIVRKPDVSLTLRMLSDFLGRSLPAHFIPERMFLLSSLPLDANSMPDRSVLQSISLPENKTQTNLHKPYNALQATLLQIWSGLLGIAEIGINDNFFELGGDSYAAVTLLHRVEKLTQWTVPLITLYNHPTVEALAQAMLELKGKNQRSPLVEIQPGVSGPPFIFMHGDFHGGGYYCYQLARFMGPSQTFYAIQPHGLPGRPAPSTIEDMADEYLKLIRAAFPQGPYFLGGHCNGALVAFEIAQRLLDEGSEVGLLVMMDPPEARNHTVTRTTAVQSPAASQAIVANIDLDRLPPLARHNTVLQLYRSICKNYAPEFYRGKLTLFLAEDGPKKPALMQGWSNMAETGDIHVVPGNHISMLTVHAPVIAKKLAECWNKAKRD